MIETVRLSDKAKHQLISLKRRTGIQHWNILCRWAFCYSLAEASVPPEESIPADSSVEMSWKTFSGGQEDLYWGLLLIRARRDGVGREKDALSRYFRLHLHRGISYLYGRSQLKHVSDLADIALAGVENKSNTVAM